MRFINYPITIFSIMNFIMMIVFTNNTIIIISNTITGIMDSSETSSQDSFGTSSQDSSGTSYQCSSGTSSQDSYYTFIAFIAFINNNSKTLATYIIKNTEEACKVVVELSC